MISDTNSLFPDGFCPNCGAQVYKGSNFCMKCGKPLKSGEYENNDIFDSEPVKEAPKKKKKTNESTKCPNCGASIKAFESHCPYCNTELRNMEVSSSLDRFTQKLEELQSKPLPQYQGKDSIMKRLIGQDYSQEKEEFEEQAEQDRAEEISRFINNYPIPNTKEDLMEFMILSRSNYDLTSNDYTIQKAWESKMKQIIQKAKLTLRDPNDIKKITDLYENRKTINRIINKLFKG